MPPSANIVAAPLAPRRLIVQVLAFDRDSPRIPIARDMLDDGALAGAVGRLWRENGLVFASLDRSRLPLLMANLPKPLTGRIWTLYNAGVDNPVTLIEKPTGRLRVDVVEADGSIQPRRFIGGEHRLLVKIEPGAEPTTGPTHLALLPQHFSRGRVLVVTPEDRSKEGFSFDQLHVRHPIGESEVWLIMADPSPPSAIPLEPPKPEPRAVTKPITLGESMLTGDYRGKPVRLIVLIGLEEEHPAP